jgi:hypothetical protein
MDSGRHLRLSCIISCADERCRIEPNLKRGRANEIYHDYFRYDFLGAPGASQAPDASGTAFLASSQALQNVSHPRLRSHSLRTSSNINRFAFGFFLGLSTIIRFEHSKARSNLSTRKGLRRLLLLGTGEMSSTFKAVIAGLRRTALHRSS